MCIILYRPAGKVIPFEDFENCVINNPHGYGLTLPKGNGTSLLTLRSASSADPEALYRLVQEEYEDVPLMLHLRYNTAGATNLRNAHPFPVLEERTHGEDLRMAHNGTIHKWKNMKARPEWESDTRHFVRGFIRPLFDRMTKKDWAKDVLTDDWTMRLIGDQIPSSSVLTFLTADGDFYAVNELGNGGFWREGVYYSNKYSLDDSHRKANAYTSYGYKSKWNDWLYDLDDKDEGDTVFFQTKDRVKNKVSGLIGTVKAASKDWVDVVLDANGHVVSYQASALEHYEEEPTVESVEDMIDGLDADAVCDCSNNDLNLMLKTNPELLVAKLVDIIVDLSYNTSLLEMQIRMPPKKATSTELVVLN